MSHALVTGGAGFIGSHVVDRLLLEGWKVTVVDNFDPFYDRGAKESNIARHRRLPGYRLVEADIRDRRGLSAQLEGRYDAVVHLAARAGVRASIEDPVGYQEVNVCGTQSLLELARQWGVKQFVFASSSSVYGVNPRVPWREEDAVLLPISPYAGTKVSGEILGHVYSHLYGIRFVSLRLFTVYGPRQRPDLAIHKFTRLMLAGKPLRLFSRGGTQRDYTYVGDIVEGIRAAMEYRDLSYEIFNLGNSRALSLCDVVAALERVLGVRAVVEYAPEQPGDVPRTWADISKARRLLGYDPKTGFEEGAARFADWLTGETGRDLLALNAALIGAAGRAVTAAIKAAP